MPHGSAAADAVGARQWTSSRPTVPAWQRAGSPDRPRSGRPFCRRHEACTASQSSSDAGRVSGGQPPSCPPEPLGPSGHAGAPTSFHPAECAPTCSSGARSCGGSGGHPPDVVIAASPYPSSPSPAAASRRATSPTPTSTGRVRSSRAGACDRPVAPGSSHATARGRDAPSGRTGSTAAPAAGRAGAAADQGLGQRSRRGRRRRTRRRGPASGRRRWPDRHRTGRCAAGARTRAVADGGGAVAGRAPERSGPPRTPGGTGGWRPPRRWPRRWRSARARRRRPRRRPRPAARRVRPRAQARSLSVIACPIGGKPRGRPRYAVAPAHAGRARSPPSGAISEVRAGRVSESPPGPGEPGGRRRRMSSSCWRAAICWANSVAWMPWNRPSSQPTSWALAMRSSAPLGAAVPANGWASRPSSSRRSGDRADDSSRDRRLVDLAEAVAAGLVELGVGLAHLLEEVLDHRADAHDLGRLLDRLGLRVAGVGLLARRDDLRVLDLWDDRAFPRVGGGAVRRRGLLGLRHREPSCHARRRMRTPGPRRRSAGGSEQRHQHLGRGQRPVASDQVIRPGVLRVVEGHVPPGDQGDVAQPGERHVGHLGPEPALGDRLLAGDAPRRRRRARPGPRRTAPRPAPARACSQRKRPSPDCIEHRVRTSERSSTTLSPTSTWPWSAVTTSAARRGSTASSAVDRVVDPARARRRSARPGRTRGRPCRARRSRRTRTARPPAAGGRPRSPCVDERAVAPEAGRVEVGAGEPGRAVLGPGHDRRPLRRGTARSAGTCRAGCSGGRRPPRVVQRRTLSTSPWTAMR